MSAGMTEREWIPKQSASERMKEGDRTVDQLTNPVANRTSRLCLGSLRVPNPNNYKEF